MRDANGLFRHGGIPESWIRCGEAGHRLGVSASTVAAWIRNGYVPGHRLGCVQYVDWNEALKSRLTRRVFDQFQAELASDVDEDLFPFRRIESPVLVEPRYA